ncbi:MAG: leucine-rich repeat protein [Clostridia bacterium]|nr:leucine-rich repeat protein [Clostridia bacterium]
MKKPALTMFISVIISLLAAFSAKADDVTFAVSDDGKYCTLTSYTGNAPEYTVPSEYAGIPVTAIGEGAFSGNVSTYKINIPQTVREIAPSAFSAMPSLYEFSASGTFIAVDGILFTADQKTLVRFPQARTGSYTVPSGVAVGGYAFSGSVLDTVDLSGAASVGDHAFYFSAISDVTVGVDTGEYAFSGSSIKTARVTGGSIGAYAFSACPSLEYADVSGGTLSGDGVFFADTSLLAAKLKSGGVIPPLTFAGCTSLLTAPVAGASEIKSRAFLGCTSLKYAVYPVKAAEDAFDLCDQYDGDHSGALSQVSVSVTEKTIKTGETFSPQVNCDGGYDLFSSSYAVEIDGRTVTARAEGTAKVYAVSRRGGACAVITVTVSDGGSVIASDHPYGTGVFSYSHTVSGGPSRIAVTFSGSDRLGPSDALTVYDKNDNVYAVYTGTASASKTLFIDGDTVKLTLVSNTGGEYGFRVVSATPVDSLPRMTSVSVKNSLVLAPGQSASLNAVITPADAFPSQLIYISGDSSVASVDANGKVTAVGAGTTDVTVYSPYYGVKAVCSVTVNSGSEGLVYAVKEDGVHVTGYNGGIFCEIPEKVGGKNVVAIDSKAFAFSTVNVITVPATVTSISDDAFDGCFSLHAVNVILTNTAYTSVDGALYSKDGKTLVRVPQTVSGAYTIKDGVETIGASAFTYCIRIESVDIPGSARNVCGSSFSFCDKLKTVSVSGGNFTCIDGVLFTSDGKTLIYFPYGYNINTYAIPASATTISAYAFNGCSELKGVVIPASVTEIDARAFTEALTLQRFVVNSSNSTFTSPDGVLYENGALKAVPKALTGSFTVPSSVTEILPYAFYNCRFLDNAVLSSRVNTIGDLAFGNCHSLKTLYLPQSLRRLGEDPFSGCTGVRVYIPDTASVTSLSDCTVMCGKGSGAEAYCAENGIPYKYSYYSSHGLYTTYSPVKGTLRVTENKDKVYISLASVAAGVPVKAYSIDIQTDGVSLPLGEYVMFRDNTSSVRYYLHDGVLEEIGEGAASVYLYRHEHIIELYGDPYQRQLSVKTNPDILEFPENAELDLSGLQLYLRGENGLTTVVTEGYTAECDMTTSGVKTVAVTYENLTTEYTITVNPAVLTGTVRITGEPRYGVRLSADMSEVLPSNAAVTYAWYRGGEKIPGADSRFYTPTAEDIGKRLTVKITGTGATGGELTSPALTIGKGKAQTPPKPAVEEATETSLKLKAVAGCEYRIGADSEFSTKITYDGMTPGKTYIIYQRYAETDTTEASAISSVSFTMPEVLKIESDVYFLNPANGVASLVKPGTSVTALLKNFKDSDKLTVYKNGKEIKGDETVGTGCEVRLYKDGKIADKYTIAITGDVNGDGKTTITDYLQIKNRIQSAKPLDKVPEYACDVNGDGKITITDYLKLKYCIQNGTAPEQNRY